MEWEVWASYHLTYKSFLSILVDCQMMISTANCSGSSSNGQEIALNLPKWTDNFNQMHLIGLDQSQPTSASTEELLVCQSEQSAHVPVVQGQYFVRWQTEADIVRAPSQPQAIHRLQLMKLNLDCQSFFSHFLFVFHFWRHLLFFFISYWVHAVFLLNTKHGKCKC